MREFLGDAGDQGYESSSFFFFFCFSFQSLTYYHLCWFYILLLFTGILNDHSRARVYCSLLPVSAYLPHWLTSCPITFEPWWLHEFHSFCSITISTISTCCFLSCCILFYPVWSCSLGYLLFTSSRPPPPWATVSQGLFPPVVLYCFLPPCFEMAGVKRKSHGPPKSILKTITSKWSKLPIDQGSSGK